jgi:hypothetical protein
MRFADPPYGAAVETEIEIAIEVLCVRFAARGPGIR